MAKKSKIARNQQRQEVVEQGVHVGVGEGGAGGEDRVGGGDGHGCS